MKGEKSYQDRLFCYLLRKAGQSFVLQRKAVMLEKQARVAPGHF